LSRVVNDGAVYAQPFSEGSAAAAGRAPFGTTARKVEGGWRINGRKIFASLLAGAANYYGVLCTEDKGDDKPRRARHAVHGRAGHAPAGFSVSGDWDPLGMRGTVSRNLHLQGRVRQRRRAAHAARHLLQGRADLAGHVLHHGPHLHGPGQWRVRLHGAVPARRSTRRAAR
jgi:alkylation response protein AidB-like acyl-CoA dehydrogenase